VRASADLSSDRRPEVRIDSLCALAHRHPAMRIRTAPLLLSTLLAAASPASAQLYKWLDENGGINYGDSPPADAKDVKAVGPASLSVVPGIPQEQMDAMRQRDEQRRMAQLQRDELEDVRARQKSSAGLSPWPSDDDAVSYDYGYGYGPLWGYGPPRGRPPVSHRPRPTPYSPPPLLPMEPLPLGQPSILKGR
jgi:hypothetical protein